MIDSSYQLSGSAAYQLHQIVAKLWQAILIKNLFENRKRIVFQILEHLPYIDLSLGRGLKDGKLFFSWPINARASERNLIEEYGGY